MSTTADGPPDKPKERTSQFQYGDFHGDWRLESEFKSGSLTRVWRATSRVDGSTGVLKFLLDDTKMARFVREYELTKGIDNGWTPKAIDADFEFPFPWIAFQHVEADTVKAVVEDPKRGPLRGEDLDEFGRQLWEARTYFDGVNMAHRDLSARNVMLRRGDGRVIIVDWGTGRRDANGETRTHHGLRSWSPGFGAPEQVLGQDVGSLADVWGWASVTYYVATGRTILPARETSYAEAIRQHTSIDWSGVPTRWLPALQAALRPVEERDPDAVTASLPLRPQESALRDAIAEAKLAEAEAATLRAELDRLATQAARPRQKELFELESRAKNAAAEAARLRPVATPMPADQQQAESRIPTRPASWPAAVAVLLAAIALIGLVVAQPSLRDAGGSSIEPPTTSQATTDPPTTDNPTSLPPTTGVPAKVKTLTPRTVESWCIPKAGVCDLGRFEQYPLPGGGYDESIVHMKTGLPVGLNVPNGYEMTAGWDCFNNIEPRSGNFDSVCEATLRAAA